MSKSKIDLEQLTQKCLGNDELVEKLIIRFQTSLPQLVDEMIQAVAQNNFVDIRNIAHRLKGEAGTMCASEICSLATRIIELAHSQHKNELALLIVDLSCSVSTTPQQEASVVAVKSH